MCSCIWAETPPLRITGVPEMPFHMRVEEGAGGRSLAEGFEYHFWNVIINIFARLVKGDAHDATPFVERDPVDHRRIEAAATHGSEALRVRDGSRRGDRPNPGRLDTQE